MNTSREPWAMARDLWFRSRCRVKVGAVLTDRKGRAFAWGWNHAGPDGRGLCAERHAISRANPARLQGATIYIRGFNRVNESVSRPCPACTEALTRAGVAQAVFRDGPSKTVTTKPVIGLEAGTARRRELDKQMPKTREPLKPPLRKAA